MRKMWIVFRREYLIRVRKKTFIIATILVPLAIAAIGVGAGLITYLGASEEKRILVKDDSGIFEISKEDSECLKFDFSKESLSDLRNAYKDSGYDLFI